MFIRLFCSLLLVPALSRAQISSFPGSENFDTVIVPALPPGWVSSVNRSPGGDFTTTSSSAYSAPNAVISTNATIEQELVSPILDFSPSTPESLSFAERRSSSHTSALLVEAFPADLSSAPIVLSDTLQNPGISGYIIRSLSLAPLAGHGTSFRIRWRVLGNGTGTTGTIRFDNVIIMARPKFDLAAMHLIFSPAHPHAGDGLDVTGDVRNIGTAACDSFLVRILIDSAGGPEHRQELLSEWIVTNPLPSGDSLRFHASISRFPSAPVAFTLTVTAPADGNRGDDTLHDTLSPTPAYGSVVINEVMYEPLPGKSEYVELFNRTASSIDVSGWHVGRIPDTTAGTGFAPFPGHTLLVGPGEFAVVAADSSLCAQFPLLRFSTAHLTIRKGGTSLLNSGDDIVLTDADGSRLDSMRYSPGWHNPAVDETAGKSLERINPFLPSTDHRNWSTCADPSGGTPGAVNSLYTRAAASISSLEVSPNPFSPDGDGFEDVTLVSYRLTFSGGVLRIRIFDSVGRLVRILASEEPTGASGGIAWNGLDDSGRRVPIGIYIILLDAYDPATGRTESAKGIVVVATKL